MHSEDVEDAKPHPTDSAARQMADMPKIILSEIYLMHLSDQLTYRQSPYEGQDIQIVGSPRTITITGRKK